MNLLELVLDTLLDALKMLPFLFLAFLLIEWIEHKGADRLRRALTGRASVPLGALLGCVPQCGFSVLAANLYCERLVTLGTLFAVFLATSDEAVIILLSQPGQAGSVLLLVGVKLVIALAAGLLIDLAFRGRNRRMLSAETGGERHGHCDVSHGILRPALLHTAKTLLFVTVISFILSLVIDLIGQERLSALLMGGSVFQPFLAALIGLIPNCASSVLLTELYLAGSVSFGSVVAGLCAGAGMGLIVLFQNGRNLKENLAIMGGLYLIGSLCGVVIGLLGL